LKYVIQLLQYLYYYWKRRFHWYWSSLYSLILLYICSFCICIVGFLSYNVLWHDNPFYILTNYRFWLVRSIQNMLCDIYLINRELLSSPPGFWWGSCYSIFSFMCMFCDIVVCPFVLFLLAVLLSVLLFTASDYPFGIFKKWLK